MKKTILLIEDNQEVRENTAEILELSDYHVITAENGKTGVELARKELPDLIICDVMMPELDGFGVLHVLSKNVTTASIPFIFLTAKAEREDMRKGMNLGADDYLTKPFDDVQLLDAIEIRLKKNEKRKSPGGSESQGLKELDQLLTVEKRISHIAKKQIIYSQGSYPNFLYYVRSGRIKTARADKLGNEFITGLFKEGDFVGYIELIENIPYNESAVALEEASVCAIPADDFFALLHSNREVAGKFIRLLSGNVVEKEERLLKLAYCSVRKRVAEALILLQQKYRQDTDEKNFTIAISRDDLSGIVGASKETVIRTLTDFKEEGLIAIAGSKITLLNEERLKSLKH